MYAPISSPSLHNKQVCDPPPGRGRGQRFTSGVEAASDHPWLVAEQQQAAAHQYPGGLAVFGDIPLQPAYEGDEVMVAHTDPA